ncbi:MAG: ribonuclease III, partial [Congregibacter sp.]|nr:ribonuclease III [Congregibacter sp.]
MDAQQWLERQFGCRLQNEALLTQALSHRSVGSRNNERLEFLGDAVLGYVISEDLYRRFPDVDEGQLSRLRVALVKGSTLAKLAREIDLGEQLRLGAGERHGGGRRRDSILADSLEALLGAIVLDQGIECARTAIFKVFNSRLDGLKLEQAQKDPKTRLQEFLQGRGSPLPEYLLRDAAGEE